MTIYQEEMQRKAYRCGCTTEYDAEENLLCIGYKGNFLTGITDKGFMHYTAGILSVPHGTNEIQGCIERRRTCNHKVARSHRKDQERFYNYLSLYSYNDLQIQMKRYLYRSNNIPMSVPGWKLPNQKQREPETARFCWPQQNSLFPFFNLTSLTNLQNDSIFF